MAQLGKLLLVVGAAAAIAGCILILAGTPGPVGDFIRKIPLGRLPGDIFVKRPGYSLYFPLATGGVISVVLSLILALLRK